MTYQDDVIFALDQLEMDVSEEHEEIDDMTVAWGRGWCRSTTV
jgi:hypothetical protein